MIYSKLFRYFQLFLTLALVIFIVLKAGEFFEKVDWQIVGQNWQNVIFAGGIFMFGYVFMARHWTLVCRLITPQARRSQWLVYLASQPYKYLPTSVFTFSSRATFAKKMGLNFKHSTEAQAIENLNLIVSALTLGIILWLCVYHLVYGILLIGLVAIVCTVIWWKRTIEIPKIKLTINLRNWLVSLVVVSCGWVIMGLGFLVMVVSLEQRVEPLLAIAANSLATGLGIVAVFAPGGIGVREVVFHYLGFASGTILLWRFTTFTVDISMGTWAAWVISRSQK